MKHFLEQLKRIWPYFAPLRVGFIVAALASVLVAASEPMIPWLLQQIIDRGFSQLKLPLWQVPVALLTAFMIRGVATFTSSYALAWTALRGSEGLRSALFNRLLDAHPSLYISRTASSLINTVAYEVQTGSSLLIRACLDLLRDSLTLVALAIYLLWLNWQLTIFVVLLLPAVALVISVLSKRVHKLTLDSQTAMDRMGYVVEENVLAWRMVRLHGAQTSQAGRFERDSHVLRRLALKSTAASSLSTPITQLLAAAALSAVIVTALWQTRSQGGSVGNFVGFVTGMLMLIAPIKRLSDVAAPITRGLASLDRAMDLIHEAPVEHQGSHAPGRCEGRISLNEVQIRYGSEGRPALDGLSLDIPAGEVVALVGPSGAGKSTIVNLLPRFVDATAGQIKVDGIDVKDWDVRALRRQFALVSQDVVLFNDSVAANVALGQPIDEDRVRSALEAAQLWPVVQALPQGMMSPVGHNGQNFSGGQRQRLAIARAIYKDAPILILDEATSALDTESERLVQTALETLMRGRTAIVIAHRLSTIERADRIIVLDQGRIVEQGSKTDLLAREGLFARLHALQFQS